MVSLNFIAVISIYHNIFLDLTQTQLLISSYMHAKLAQIYFIGLAKKFIWVFKNPNEIFDQARVCVCVCVCVCVSVCSQLHFP